MIPRDGRLRLADRHSPVLDPALRAELAALGQVQYVVASDRFHHFCDGVRDCVGAKL